MKRYLVLVHLAAAFPKAELTTRAAAMHAALKSTLDTMETVLTADRGFAFACLSAKPAAELWKSIVAQGTFARQDNISVVELGFDICTTHPGLASWHQQTGLFAGLAESARKK